MKRSYLALFALALLALAAYPYAQNKNVPARVGFVDAESLIQAHPAYPEVQKLQQQADAAMRPLIEKLTPLEQKLRAGTATEKERQDYQTLSQALKKVQDEWRPKIQDKLNPIVKDVDAAIARVAEAQGFSVVMNRRVAAQSNLVVYAAPSTDLTEAVIQELRKTKP